MPDTTAQFDPNLQTEDIAYSPQELIRCNACERQNPPDRLRCLYCGDTLQGFDSTSVKLTFRSPEAWEKGWNVILRRVGTGAKVEEAADLLGLDDDELKLVLRADVAFPAARVEARDEAETIERSLSDLGFIAAVVSDHDLEGGRPPVRLAELTMDGVVGAVDFNTRMSTPLVAEQLSLIVAGTIKTSKTDTVEKRRRGKTKLLDEVATTADESVIDVYSADDPIGYRIQMSGFDFSCLGNDKTMLAAENIRRLLGFLKEKFPRARIVSAYDDLSDHLSHAWPLDVQKGSRGFVHAGIGKRELGKSETVNNLNQFTKFSRLQWHLL